jgi:hypothetical protein
VERPYIQCSIDELESHVRSAQAAKDVGKLKLILHELNQRKDTGRPRQLRVKVEGLIANGGECPEIEFEGFGRTAGEPPKRGSAPKQGTMPRQNGSGSNGPLRFTPTREQLDAAELFVRGGSLKINAYAGTGKTSTLSLLARSTNQQGQYIAFNRSIVADAKDKFPDTVNCSTTHGLAFRAMAGRFRNDKLRGKINAHKLADLLKLKKWRIDEKHVLSERSLAYLLLETTRRFAQSADPEPAARHIPQLGILATADKHALNAVTDVALSGAKHIWGRMCAPEDPLPLGHDGYLKLWALSDPVIAADYIMLDEAQDTNPVVLDLLRKQPAQIVYVGDKYQQIYEWRGAVNAMENIVTDSSVYLTTSFRFGPAIAAAASHVLNLLGERRALRGNSAINSQVGPTKARAVLARTNASTISVVIDALNDNQRPHLVGGTDDLMHMLRGVSDLKAGHPSSVPDFFGFENWREVIEFAKGGEGADLVTFVNLVESRGENRLMWALKRTVAEDDCDLIISTAHKAKGREWPTVRLTDDFLKSRLRKVPEGKEDEAQPGIDPAELRLFYVALTRGKIAVELPESLLELVGLRREERREEVVQPRPPSDPARHANASGSQPPPPRRDEIKENLRNTEPPRWQSPRDWRPPKPSTAAAVREQPQPSAVHTPQNPKGKLDWLFGK